MTCLDSSKVTRYHDVILERYRKYGKIYKETIAGETVVHLLDPDYIQLVYQNETKIPHIVPLMETTQAYRRLRKMSPGLGNRSLQQSYDSGLFVICTVTPYLAAICSVF